MKVIGCICLFVCMLLVSAIAMVKREREENVYPFSTVPMRLLWFRIEMIGKNINSGSCYLVVLESLLQNVSIGRRNSFIVRVLGLDNLKAKFLIEIDGIFVVNLHMKKDAIVFVLFGNA